MLFILSDQHNAKVLGVKNHPDVKTPNLDKLAAEGVRFENAITQNPICTPSRVSWISGQYCHNHGYYGLSGPKPKGLPTIFGHFKAAGYKTAAFGKIHCPKHWVEEDCDVFHETAGTSFDGRSTEYAQYLEERGLIDLEDHKALNEFGNKGVQTVEGRASKVTYRDGQEGWAVSKSIEFMADCVNKNTPFFVHVSLPKPHQCYTPAQEFWDLYEESKLTLPPNADYDMEGKAPHLRETARRWKSGGWLLFEPKTFEAGRLRKLHGYLGNVSHVDHAVGELVNWLDENNLSDNTIVIYSADHGDYACEHGIMEKAPGICSDAITRIPMIWRWPKKFKKGHVAEEIVESIDLTTTLCDLTGLDYLETSDGQDISHLLKGKKGKVHEIGVTEFMWSKSIRKDQYRYVYYPIEMFGKEYPEGFGELYDLEKDPWEMTNLFFNPDYSQIIQRFQRYLTDWIITTTRPATFLGSPRIESPQSESIYGHHVNKDGKMNSDLIRMVGNNYK